jgi:hypothetical protein
MNLSRQKGMRNFASGEAKFRHPFGCADLDQRQAGSVRRRYAMAQQAVPLCFAPPALFAAKKNCVYFSTVVWDRWNVSCKRMSREEAPI